LISIAISGEADLRAEPLYQAQKNLFMTRKIQKRFGAKRQIK